MAVRDWLSRFGAKASVIGLSSDELPDRPLEKGFDDATLLSTYRDDAWPYILANKGAEQASQAPLVLGRMVGEEFEKVPANHPVQQLFDSPNPTMDGGEFIHLLWVYMEIAGHSPIEIVKPEGASVIGAPGRRGTRQRSGFEMWLVNPGPWRIVANRDATIKGYLWLRTSETDIKWAPEQMTYLRWPNPADRWYGQGRVAAVRNEIMAEEYASIRDKRFEKNLGVPPGILSSEMPLGEPQAVELQKRWEQATGGYRNAGKIAVLGSKTSYQTITPNAREAEWLNQRKWRVETQAAAFGIPVPLIIMQDAKFANLQGARAELWEGTLQPRLNRIARMLTHRLIPLLTSEPLVARFDYDAIEALGENDLEAAQTAAAWSNTGAVTVGEIRKRLSLEPLADKAANERLLVPTTLQLQTTYEIASAAKLGADAQQATIDTTRNPPAPKAEPQPRRRGKAKEDDVAALHPVREAYKRDLGAFFSAQLGALTPVFPRKALPDDDTILERVLAILAEVRFRERLRRISEGPISIALTLGAAEAAELLDIAVSFSIPASQDALAFLTTHLEALGAAIQGTTLAEVREVLEKALRDGLTNAQMRAELGKLFDGYQDWRLDRISRTEVRAAYNLGALKQYRQAGVSMVHVVDGDDPFCAEWNGRTVSLDEAETSPLGHPNCRRTWIPVTTDLGRGEFTDSEASLDARAVDGLIKALGSAHDTIKAQQQPVTVTIAEGAVQNHTTVEAAPTPNVQVDAPIVNLPETPVTFTQAPINVTAPNVTVKAPDMTPVAKAVATLRGDMADLKVEVRKPRTRRLVKDDLGRPIGSEEV